MLSLQLFKGLKAEFRDKRIKISTELYRKGCVESAEEGLEAAQKIGFPVMIKASEGGGGKGIRKSESADDFANLFRQVLASVFFISRKELMIHIFYLRFKQKCLALRSSL